MTKKRLLWAAVTTAALVATVLVVKRQYVLDSEDLAKAISKELPVGTPKPAVINFLQKRHPLFCDDLGTQVKARLSGLAENLIYRKDIVLIFEFDPAGKVTSCSKQEYLTFF